MERMTLLYVNLHLLRMMEDNRIVEVIVNSTTGLTEMELMSVAVPEL